MGRLTKFAAVTACLALAVTGCAKKDTESSSTSGAKGALCKSGGDGPKIGLAYDVGGRGDKGFNDLAAEATKKASDELDATCKESEPSPDEPDSAKEERLRTLADAGYNPIVAVGFVYTPMVTKVAKDYPKVKFAVVDGAAEGKNVTDLVFKPEQGSYLVGVAAGLKTKTDKVGFVGGVKGPIIDPFAAGFQAGVKKVNPKAKVEFKWLSDEANAKAFQNVPGGRTAANALYDDGVRHRLPRRGPVEPRRVRGGGQAEEARDRRRLRPVPRGTGRSEAVHHHLGPQAGRRGDLRLHSRLQGRQDEAGLRRL